MNTMTLEATSNNLDVKIHDYEEKVYQLDRRSMRLPREVRNQYRAARNRFIQQLEAWKKSFYADISIFRNSVEESYHELESFMYRTQ